MEEWAKCSCRERRKQRGKTRKDAEKTAKPLSATIKIPKGEQ